MLLLSSPIERVRSQSQPDDWRTFTDSELGFSIDYPAHWSLKPTWETGQSAVAAFTGAEARAFVIVENRLQHETINDLLVMRDVNLTGNVISEQYLTINGISGMYREMEGLGPDTFSFYVFIGNKFLEFNAIVLDIQAREMLEKMLASLVLTPTAATIPEITTNSGQTRPSEVNYDFPNLKFPFPCDETWEITNDYAGHQANCSGDAFCLQYNRYALDFVPVEGSAYGKPIIAAHSGLVHTGWDSYGGGNIIKIAYDGDFNHYVIPFASSRSA
jgi:hypothetical protein